MSVLVGRTEEPVSGPILRYHGGKWKLAPWIISHFTEHRVYVEPYCGGLSVLMRKPRTRCEIVNDLDGQIVNVFRVLRDPEQASRLEKMLALTPYAREAFDLSYEESEDPVEQARRTIIRGFLGCSTRGTSGGHRTGFRYSDCGGTVAEKIWARYPDRVHQFCRRLSGVVIENKPAIEVIDGRDASRDGPHALYYCDPPYIHSTRQEGSHWRRAYKHEMTDADHVDLAERLHRIRGMAVVSGYSSALYDELYGDWERREHKAYADGSRERTECIWLSPRVSEALGGRLF